MTRLPALALAATCVALAWTMTGTVTLSHRLPGATPGHVRPVPAQLERLRPSTVGSGNSRAGQQASARSSLTDEPTLTAARRYAGTATWYCGGGSPCTRGYGPSDLVAAIDTDLGFRKGERIVVRAFGRAVTVRVVDVCACAGERLVDLSRKAFYRLANPDYGVIAVTVELARERAVPVGPETDVGP